MPSQTARQASVLVKFNMSVSTTPGATALTRIPRAPSVEAKCFTRVSMAPLVAAYAGNTNNGTRRGAKNLPKLRRDLQELQKPVSDLGAGAGMMTRLATGATLTIGAVGGLGY